MYCSQCGSELASDARFCANCGASIARETRAPAETSKPRFDPYDPQSAERTSPPPTTDATPGRPAFMHELPATVRLSSAWRRLGGYLLEGLLILLTLLIGWLVWSIIVWGRGQTPAKQLLGMRVLNRETLVSAGRGRMFAREIPCKWIIELFASITVVGFVVYFWLLWDKERQELWDKMVETIVVNDPENVLDPRR
jgi:uncharacterized RDD family membrane protein YckC